VTINSGENLPPNKPSTPVGPSSGKAGKSYTYTTSVVDPDGDQLYYIWDWGDEISDWEGPYTSGDPISVSHIWSNQGTYSIKVKAKDINDMEGVWSDQFTVSMPKSKSFPKIPVLNFLDKYSQLLPLIRQLLKI
jgi:hypothetical protein